MVDQVYRIAVELKNGDHMTALEKYNRLASTSNVVDVRLVSLERIYFEAFDGFSFELRFVFSFTQMYEYY